MKNKKANERADIGSLARSLLLAGLAFGLGASALQAEESSELRPGDAVVLFGDTPAFGNIVGNYLAVCQPDIGVLSTNFAGRLGDLPKTDGELLFYASPNFAIMSFAVREAGLQKSSPELLAAYRQNLLNGIQTLKAGGVRAILLLSPTAVDPDMYAKLNLSVSFEEFCQTLADLSAVTAEVARDQKLAFVDVLTPMTEVLKKAKAANGPEYLMTMPDFIYPSANSGIVVADAILKALKCDGNIGNLTLDMAAGTATATEGHKVISSDKNRLEIESTRYPYCFTPSQEGFRSSLAFTPFNDDLNRYLLTVKNPPAENLKVTWGTESKQFTAEQLKKGINLAAEFPTNPFSGPFDKALGALGAKNLYLGYTAGRLQVRTKELDAAYPESQAAAEDVRKAILTEWNFIKNTKITEPVRHVILIEPVAPSAAQS